MSEKHSRTNSDHMKSARHLFGFYKELGEKAIDQLDDEQIHWLADKNANSIATIVKHLSGNMLSRWTDFLNSDGEKEWRNRESEFDETINDKKELREAWEKGWQCLFNAIDPLTDEDLDRTVYIRSEAHSVLEAVNRQLTHYAYHVGQIVFIAKTLKSDDWQSLSIPRGKSEAFNKKKRGN